MQHPRGLDLPLETRPVEGELEISGAGLMEHLDDAVPPEVGRIRHRRPPVALHAARILMEQLGIPVHQLADNTDIVAANRIRHAAGQDETRPGGDTVASRESELCISEPGTRGKNGTGMALLEFSGRRGIATPESAQ
jgi:hypothetical protein